MTGTQDERNAKKIVRLLKPRLKTVESETEPQLQVIYKYGLKEQLG